ncbi:MAG TPA: selenocysteine-specific translation elongation factor [Dehalococcoidia bacterium]|nr:selenocysteine-specific translation elongation factor [Dehalococcoidia bacterium]
MYTIGTAGHVDHGKSALVQALTGIDPDRLREEKERGLTIDLGFAWLTLPSGREVSIVDVPGHERFIRNMLAGVGGIDVALLVIAADEGVMPQTREHLAILDLLQVQRGVIVISKRDLVDEEWLLMTQADVAEAVAGTTLAGAPIIACSAITREGLPELLDLIDQQLDVSPPRADRGRPRLPIDRAFTIAGFGTVVTGTLIDGSLKVGQEVEVLPGGLRSRIRGLETHGQRVEVAPPGRRTAVNLSGLEVEQLGRGMVLAWPGTLRPTKNLDVRLRAVPHLTRALRHNSEVSFHSGAAEVPGRLLLLDRETLPPGQEAWAQLRLAEEVAVLSGDHYVLRDPNDTLGGGRIVAVDVRRHRRFHEPTLQALALRQGGSTAERLALALEDGEPASVAQAAKRAQLAPDGALEALGELLGGGEVVSLTSEALTEESIVISAAGLEQRRRRAIEALQIHHSEFPLRPGMPREDLRRRLSLEPRPFDLVLTRLRDDGSVAESGLLVRLPEHAPSLPPGQEEAARAFLLALQRNPYAPAPAAIPEPDLLAYLEERGDIVRVGDGVVFSAEAYRQMRERIVAHLRSHGSVTLAQVRDMFGNSRKYVQPLLEHLDAQRVTRRVGDERVLRDG